MVRSGAVLAAVRDATRAGADGEAAAAPFAEGPWLFSHNGSVRDWPDAAAPVAASLAPQELLSLAARTDSALLWALVLHRLRKGDALGAALAAPVRELAEAAPGSRLNLLLTDGRTIAATAWGTPSGTWPTRRRSARWWRRSPTTTTRAGPRCPTGPC